ncbi:MAG: Laminin sub domain 2, partial [Pedosphaera sp.]|nr:Laminin sub domain 2 [Pedosphaera sp.]
MKLNHKRAFGMILSLWVAGAAHAQVIGYWNFEEKLPGNAADITTNAIADISGNFHPGTISDTGVFYAAGNTNYAGASALEFTSAPNHVAVPDPTGVFNFSSAQSVTVEAMIKTVTIGQDGVGALVCKQGASPGEWWWRINATGTQQFFVDDGTGSRNVSGTKKLNDGRWHHVAAVFDATAQQLRVYVDYIQDGPTVTTTYSSGAPIGNAKDLWIGAFQTGNREFAGDIDFVRISASALAPADFVQPQTYITGVVPQSGSGFLSVTNAAGFEVKSPAVGVLTNNIHVVSNGIDISGQLLFSGNANDWLVSLPAL